MIRRSLKEIAGMCGGTLEGGNINICGVSTDTRTIGQGNLYIPLKGANFDGHEFIHKAVENGAAACLWERQRQGALPEIPCILVEDCLAALQNLAASYVQETGAYIIAITGSNGKTSTKDMLAAILKEKYRTKYNKGNLNNHIGLPLTLLDFDDDTEMGIVEMGMSALGEISLLSSIAKPDMAVITNIGEAHLADLGSRENIARAKLEILDGLKEGGIFIADCEDPLVRQALAEKKGIALSYESGGGQFFPKDISFEEDGMAFAVENIAGRFKIPLFGRHQVYNGVCAVVCAHMLIKDGRVIAKGLKSVVHTGQRGDIYALGRHRIIDDTYKSNPSGMKAAIENLACVEWGGLKAILMGDMRDLGGEEESLHREIGGMIHPETAGLFITVGKGAAYAAREAASRHPGLVVHILGEEEKMDAAHIILKAMEKQPVMLLAKGARVLKLEEVLKAVKEKYNK